MVSCIIDRFHFTPLVIRYLTNASNQAYESSHFTLLNLVVGEFINRFIKSDCLLLAIDHAVFCGNFS